MKEGEREQSNCEKDRRNVLKWLERTWGSLLLGDERSAVLLFSSQSFRLTAILGTRVTFPAELFLSSNTLTHKHTHIHMKIAGVSHRGGLWGDDKIETGRNVFECVSANTPISAKCSSSLKIPFRESNYSGSCGRFH